MTELFIDRAKLEGVADTYLPDWETNPSSRAVREGFLLGIEAARVLLDESAETEWGVATLWTMSMRGHEPQPSEEAARTFAARYDVPVVSRRVLRTAWTTDEEGK